MDSSILGGVGDKDTYGQLNSRSENRLALCSLGHTELCQAGWLDVPLATLGCTGLAGGHIGLHWAGWLDAPWATLGCTGRAGLMLPWPHWAAPGGLALCL